VITEGAAVVSVPFRIFSLRRNCHICPYKRYAE
jgi:hypothetical protein